MFKKLLISVLACTTIMAPALAGAATNEDLEAQIAKLKEDFNQKLEVLQGQMKEQERGLEDFGEKSEGWDLASRIQFNGDIRSRLDYNGTSVPTHYNAREVALAMRNFGMVNENTTAAGIKSAVNQFKTTFPTVAGRQAAITAGGGSIINAYDLENDSLWTTRFRLNMRAKATENIEVKTRLVGYKVWGMQSALHPETDDGVYSPYFLTSRSFDGTVGRQPENSMLLVDRAFMNWNNIGGMPVWFSIGRRPTTDGPPSQLRLGADQRLATPVAYMDYPFDGISLGYAYNNLFGMEDTPGRIRFCSGRGFESGPNRDGQGTNDVDFAGFSWDIFTKGNRFLNVQSFAAMNIFNIPGDTAYTNPIEIAAANDKTADGNPYLDSDGAGPDTANAYYGSSDIYLDRMNLGNIYHTSAVYMDKYDKLNYFLAGGWSHTAAKGVDELGASLLGAWGAEPENKDGYSLYAGVRYDMDDIGLKLGAEYNWGSKNWLGFTPGHDDLYASKLYTRGSVYEVYGIYDLPAGEVISKYGKAFIRLGYQHYDYDYTYSGMWLGEPVKIDELSDPLTAQFYAPIKDMDQVYLTIEASF